MTRAVRIHRFGGPEVLEFAAVDIAALADGEVRVRHEAIGLNMVDTYFRTGLYPLELPSGLGSEAAGVITAVGASVDGLVVGDRVAYASPPPLDAYSGERNIRAKWVVKIPDDVSAETAAAVMLKGLTSWYLLNRSYAVSEGDWVLLYAAAGGVGLIAAQWARRLGVRVIGVVGSAAKREQALAHGCEEVLVADEDIVARVRGLTAAVGVAAVYDSIGKDTFWQSLDSLRRHGVLVSFGNASGAVEPFSPLELAKRGSLYVTRPTLYDFIGERSELEAGAAELFSLVSDGSLRIEINQRYPLAEIANAHRELEARRTTGSSVITL
jgi:NADPH2:quinone reductase